jgi:RNA polymerase sigma-70 factor (sigma-E family)
VTRLVSDEGVLVSHGAETPAFAEWVEAHGDALTRFAMLVLGRRGLADDAVQEALSRAMTRWDRIVRTDDPLAYVRRMIVNAHVSEWRRSRRREVPAAYPPESVVETVAGPDDELWRLCLALPVRQRAAVVLRYYEGLSYAEVAKVLGVSDVTARTQTHRALKTLRAALEVAADE